MANGKKKKSKKKIFIFGGIGVLLLALVLIAILGGSKEEIVAVQTEKVQKRDITQTVAATGKINPEFKVPITSEVTGEIVSLPVEEGDKVKKGQLLIKIKGDAYVAQKERAEASLQSANANLTMRKAELDKITQDYNRMKELHNKNLASDSELETANSNYLTTKALYQSAEANVLQSEASLKEIIDQLNKTTIYSPIDGVVTQLNVELGERVLGSGYSMGTDIMTVSDLRNIEATVEVDENDVVLISVGDTAKIKVDAFGDRVFKGAVTQIGNSAVTTGLGTQEQVVNFEVRIKLLEPDDALRPGMSCNADVETETVHQVISVPIQSVTARSDFNMEQKKDEEETETVSANNNKTNKKIQEIVFIIEKSKAKKLNVETGISDDNYIQIKSGLSGKEDVVSGSYRAISRELNDDVTVRVENKGKNAPGNSENN
ncbi:MAG: efflux transporter periplasmic adaptor subunit [Ignavibacteria bacterium GWC2_36_12]|nr:MAG: efflux transporter periplasmic adaptor subunit [Ignavibacteria bacterium GWC2_36_12]